jgi:transcriptional regulator with XRE-family HTH domain
MRALLPIRSCTVTDNSKYRTAWATYLRHMMSGRTQADLAKLIGVTDGQLSKWLSTASGVTPEKVVEIARRLGDNPVHALARVGWLTPADLAPFRVPRQYGLDEYEDRELAMEIVRRIDAGEATHWVNEPLEVDELAHRRDRRDVGSTRDDLPAVAREADPDRGEDND